MKADPHLIHEVGSLVLLVPLAAVSSHYVGTHFGQNTAKEVLLHYCGRSFAGIVTFGLDCFRYCIVKVLVCVAGSVARLARSILTQDDIFTVFLVEDLAYSVTSWSVGACRGGFAGGLEYGKIIQGSGSLLVGRLNFDDGYLTVPCDTPTARYGCQTRSPVYLFRIAHPDHS